MVHSCICGGAIRRKLFFPGDETFRFTGVTRRESSELRGYGE